MKTQPTSSTFLGVSPYRQAAKAPAQGPAFRLRPASYGFEDRVIHRPIDQAPRERDGALVKPQNNLRQEKTELRESKPVRVEKENPSNAEEASFNGIKKNDQKTLKSSGKDQINLESEQEKVPSESITVSDTDETDGSDVVNQVVSGLSQVLPVASQDQPIDNDVAADNHEVTSELAMSVPKLKEAGAADLLAVDVLVDSLSESLDDSTRPLSEADLDQLKVQKLTQEQAQMIQKFDQMLQAYGAEQVHESDASKLSDLQGLLQAHVQSKLEAKDSDTEGNAITTDATLKIAKEDGILTKVSELNPIVLETLNQGSQEIVSEVDGIATLSEKGILPEQEGLEAKDNQTNSGEIEAVKTGVQKDDSFANLKVDPMANDLSVEATQQLKQQQLNKVSPTAILEQIKEAMFKAPLKQGEKSEMVLQLKPEALGKVELKIEVHKDQVIAKFDVASTIVKETIESNLSDLKNSLKDKGFSDMTFDVNVSKERTSQGEQSKRYKPSKSRVASGYIDNTEMPVVRDRASSLAKMLGETHFEHYA